LELASLHSFFKDGKARMLNYKASAETEQIIRNRGLYIKDNDNGFTLYSSNNESKNEIFNYLYTTLEIESLEFEITSTDPLFFNYTELPLNWVGQITYSTSSETTGKSDNAITLTPKLSENMSTSKLGAIQFLLEDLIAQPGDDSVKYEIQFDARKTQWNYYIIPQKQMEGLAITNKSGLIFNGPEQVNLPNVSSALKFSSGKELIALQESSDLKIDLIQHVNLPNGSATTETIFSNLPLADRNKIGIVKTEEGQLATSEMYIYI